MGSTSGSLLPLWRQTACVQTEYRSFADDHPWVLAVVATPRRSRDFLSHPLSAAVGDLRTCLRRVYWVYWVVQGCRPGVGASRRVITPTIAHLTIATEVLVSRS